MSLVMSDGWLADPKTDGSELPSVAAHLVTDGERSKSPLSEWLGEPEWLTL